MQNILPSIKGKNRFLLIAVTVMLTAVVGLQAGAHQPVLEKSEEEVEKVSDPTVASLAIYGSLLKPGEIDRYSFTVSKDADIPFEVLVPVRAKNENFRPALRINPGDIGVPASLGERETFFEPYSMEKLYHGTEVLVSVKTGTTYLVEVYDPLNQTGDYALGIGAAENFENVSFTKLLARVVYVKLGIGSVERVPWIDIIGLFLFIAGFVIGLGAVTVIDMLGFLGRQSSYWTESAIRVHKVTKPLIWLGIVLATLGGIITYRASGLSGVALFQLILLAALVINGLFLSLKISPYLLAREKEGKSSEVLAAEVQRKITTSFIVSFIGWWSALFLLVWYLLVSR